MTNFVFLHFRDHLESELTKFHSITMTEKSQMTQQTHLSLWTLETIVMLLLTSELKTRRQRISIAQFAAAKSPTFVIVPHVIIYLMFIVH